MNEEARFRAWLDSQSGLLPAGMQSVAESWAAAGWNAALAARPQQGEPVIDAAKQPALCTFPELNDYECGNALPCADHPTEEDFAARPAAPQGNIHDSRIQNIERVIQRICELPDRSSPDDWPEAMLVTADELRYIVEEEFASAAPSDERIEQARDAAIDLMANVLLRIERDTPCVCNCETGSCCAGSLALAAVTNIEMMLGVEFPRSGTGAEEVPARRRDPAVMNGRGTSEPDETKSDRMPEPSSSLANCGECDTAFDIAEGGSGAATPSIFNSPVEQLRAVINGLIEFGDHLRYCQKNDGIDGRQCDCGRDEAVAAAKKFIEESGE